MIEKTEKYTEEQQWLQDMEDDAVSMGAYDFALKHKAYNLVVWERMQGTYNSSETMKQVKVILGQTKVFLNACMKDLSPEDLINSDTSRWLNYTITKIEKVLLRLDKDKNAEIQTEIIK